MALVYVHRDGVAETEHHVEVRFGHQASVPERKQKHLQRRGEESRDPEPVKHRAGRQTLPGKTDQVDLPTGLGKGFGKGHGIGFGTAGARAEVFDGQCDFVHCLQRISDRRSVFDVVRSFRTGHR